MTRRIFRIAALVVACALNLSACSDPEGSNNTPASAHALAAATPDATSPSIALKSSHQPDRRRPLSFLQTRGTKWVDQRGNPVVLKGTNLGNWLLQEFWMMGQSVVSDQCTLEQTLTTRFGAEENERLMDLFRDSWITQRDWDLMADFELNVIRLPFIYSLIEDDANPYHLRADAWEYLDYAIAQAEARGMYVILDLHGAAGSQGREHHSGCANRNWFWDGGNGQTAEYYQDRTIWLWEQIAKRYKHRKAVAAYGLLNEPWGTDATTLATFIDRLYTAVRAVDRKHIIVLPGHNSGIDAYGDPAARGMTNVAFEMHFYPGLFGWGQIGYGVHRDWLKCGPEGTTGVCEWRDRLRNLRTPFLIGEMQPWVGQGDLGGKITRATYDTYGAFGWATTNWSYKVFTNGGGQGAGTWGMVTNLSTQEVLVKANTWDCDNWDSTFAAACNTNADSITIGGTGSSRTMYLVIKSGACCGGSLDVTYDRVSLVNDATGEEMVINGDFGSGAGWTEWNINGTQTLDYAYTANTPTGGHGAALRVSGAADNNGGIYQAVQLTPGQSYTFTGVFKDVGSASASAWAEIYLVENAPTPGVDIVGTAIPNVNFTTASLAEIEDLFDSFATLDYDVHRDVEYWLTTDKKPTIFTLPARPDGLTLTHDGVSAQLQWNANSEKDLTGYNVYRGSIQGNYTRIASVTEPAYTDSTIVAGRPYFYVVAATDPEDESFLSEDVSIQGEPAAIPGVIEAESFIDMLGVQTENTADAGGGLNVGFLDAGDWFEYSVNVQTAGAYTVQYRIASLGGSNGFELTNGATVLDAQSIPDTGGWQSWVTITDTVTLSAGEQILRVNVRGGGGWNINWIAFSQD
jgi:endoglucanase